MKHANHHNLLFRIACDALKLLAIITFGFMAACLFLFPFGAAALAQPLVAAAMPFFLKLAVCILSVIAIAGLLESIGGGDF